jgi:magnesium chelatase family protein
MANILTEVCTHGDHKKATSRTPDGKMPAESRSSPREIQSYLGRISGPLLDRIDLHIEVPAVKFQDITTERSGESSAQIRTRVVDARRRQQLRFKDKPRITCNARMGSRELKQYCALDESTLKLLKFAMDDLNLNRPRLRPRPQSRPYHRRPGWLR